jgi:hypothetical protein
MDSSQCLKTTLRNGQTTCTSLFNCYKKYHKQKKMTNLLRNALTSFLIQQRQNTMDHSNILNMAQERTSKISTLPFHWLFKHGIKCSKIFFWKNSDHTFFELGNYCGQQKKNTKQPLDNLHMMDGLRDEIKITSFDMFCPITCSPRSKSLSLNIE